MQLFQYFLITLHFAIEKSEVFKMNRTYIKIFAAVLTSLFIPISSSTTVTFASENVSNQQVTVEELVEIERAEREIYQDNIEAQQLADSLPIQPDFKNYERAPMGSWSWRDGIICVSTNGKGSGWVNTWHAGIVAPQQYYAVAEAPGPGKKVQLRTGMWREGGNHTVYQVGVNSTSINQDWKAGYWAGQQVGKPYNLNFTDIKRTDKFYCSQLVWAAYYYTAGVDLNTSYGGTAIHPREFVINNPKTSIIYRSR